MGMNFFTWKFKNFLEWKTCPGWMFLKTPLCERGASAWILQNSPLWQHQPVFFSPHTPGWSMTRNGESLVAGMELFINSQHRIPSQRFIQLLLLPIVWYTSGKTSLHIWIIFGWGRLWNNRERVKIIKKKKDIWVQLLDNVSIIKYML